MFNRIKTSKENKELISKLTKQLNLGKENVIARMAFVYSLSKDIRLNLKEIKDSEGKEYSKPVLFGEYTDIYIGMLSVHYGIPNSHPEIGRYVKMHIDDGLELINNEVLENANSDGFDYLIKKMNLGITLINND